MRLRRVEEGVPRKNYKSNNDDGHDGKNQHSPRREASGPGVLGVQKKKKKKKVGPGGDLALEEGNASEDDDPDI